MQVELLYHTPDPERAIATAARLCYAPVGAAELMEAMPEERVKSVLSTIMSAGHTSTLEHASYTFAVDGVSRALTHQLVRHRIASFNQQSQRYVKFQGDIPMVKPATVAADPECDRLFDEAAAAVAEAYRALVDAGISREDAYVIVQRNAMKVWEDIQNAVDGPTYRERLEADDEAMALLSQEKLDEIFDPWDFLTRKDVVFDRLQELEF